jgi:hypothetical protein
MVPMTALRMVDIPSNAARLLPKPMLPNAAKTTRMIIRRQKRTSTWVDLSSRGRFGTCAKVRKLRRPLVRGLAEIVAAHRLVERIHFVRHGGDAGPASGRSEALGVDECAQDRQRQIGVVGFDRSIEPVG